MLKKKIKRKNSRHKDEKLLDIYQAGSKNNKKFSL